MSDHQRPIDLSLICPCYQGLPQFLEAVSLYREAFSEAGLSYEIILVDDGSQPAIQQESLSDIPELVLVSLAHNQGKGAALRAGFAKAAGSIQLFTDADWPFVSENLLQAYQSLKGTEADVIIGDRTLPASRYFVEISWLRHAGSMVVAALNTRLLRQGIRDTQCGLKGFKKEAAVTLFPKTKALGFGIDFELLYLAFGHNYKVKRIPVQLRKHQPGTVRVWRDGVTLLKEIAATLWRHRHPA